MIDHYTIAPTSSEGLLKNNPEDAATLSPACLTLVSLTNIEFGWQSSRDPLSFGPQHTTLAPSKTVVSNCLLVQTFACPQFNKRIGHKPRRFEMVGHVHA